MNELNQTAHNYYHPKKQWPNWKYVAVIQNKIEVFTTHTPSLAHNFIKVNQLKNAHVKFVRS